MFKLLNDKGFWQTAIRLATPIALQNILISSFTLADTLFVSRLGDVSLSAVGMIGQWGWLLNMVLIGISSGTSVFVAQYWGVKEIKKINKVCGIATVSALLISCIYTSISLISQTFVVNIFNNNTDVVNNGTSYLLIVCLSYSLILFTSIMFFPKTFAGIFTDNKELVNFAAKMLRVYCAGIGLFGIQIACQMTFVSIGSSLSSILVAVFRKIIVLIPLIYIIPLLIKNKILGVYLAEPIADISAVIFTIILFSFKFKKSLKLIEG
jgi:Na+-driven multidrug efflux pump